MQVQGHSCPVTKRDDAGHSLLESAAPASGQSSKRSAPLRARFGFKSSSSHILGLYCSMGIVYIVCSEPRGLAPDWGWGSSPGPRKGERLSAQHFSSAWPRPSLPAGAVCEAQAGPLNDWTAAQPRGGGSRSSCTPAKDEVSAAEGSKNSRRKPASKLTPGKVAADEAPQHKIKMSKLWKIAEVTVLSAHTPKGDLAGSVLHPVPGHLSLLSH